MKPAPPSPAFRGDLLDIGLDFPSREMVLHVSVPLDHLDGVFKVLGIPPGYERNRPSPRVIVLPASGSGEAVDVAVQAAIVLLTRAAREGLVALTSRLVEQVGDLAELYGAVDKADA